MSRNEGDRSSFITLSYSFTDGIFAALALGEDCMVIAAGDGGF